MNIHIASGLGTGPTKMAAFDAALQAAGAANYNLIRLSSIIPGGAKVIEEEGTIKQVSGKWGDRLYVVMAELRIDTPNVEAWAGIGWVQNEKTGEGLFVEHEGANEATVRRDIEQSMKALIETRGKEFGPLNMKVAGITCLHEPVCALVIAVYQASGWKDKPRIPRLS
ncbi:MAG TPA: pyruvoyl-dependent arginine decarboxylase [Candidatus Saccharimonadales bacterium]|nr:pyruvoyl-dependent arginine decarboxylase [Candidatus Saccharimonadales bacterium]